MKTNKDAKYYTPPGSYNGLVKIGRYWHRVNELNRIDKSDWIRWQGPPTQAMLDALQYQKSTQAYVMFPERAIHSKRNLS